jgi:hypothetical protein
MRHTGSLRCAPEVTNKKSAWGLPLQAPQMLGKEESMKKPKVRKTEPVRLKKLQVRKTGPVKLTSVMQGSYGCWW